MLEEASPASNMAGEILERRLKGLAGSSNLLVCCRIISRCICCASRAFEGCSANARISGHQFGVPSFVVGTWRFLPRGHPSFRQGLDVSYCPKTPTRETLTGYLLQNHFPYYVTHCGLLGCPKRQWLRSFDPEKSGVTSS